MKTVRQIYNIKASPAAVWQALIDPKKIIAWGGGPVVMDSRVDTKFKLWGSEIHGTNILVIPHKKLVQDWYGGVWPQPSKVTFTLTPQHDATRLELHHENIPDAEAKDIDAGWREYYLGPLKDYLENTKPAV